MAIRTSMGSQRWDLRMGLSFLKKPPPRVVPRSAAGGSDQAEAWSCSLLQIIRLDLSIQGRPFDVQDGGRLALVPVGVLERAEDVEFFQLFERHRLIGGRRGGRRRAVQVWRR